MPTKKVMPTKKSADAISPLPVEGIVVTPNFVRAARDAGYRTTASAIAELVDNAIQARASTIDIDLSRIADGDPSITVSDDGDGMSRAELGQCLRFGGTSRFNNRLSLGRYGMGLPSASISQARSVTVHSWRIDKAVYTVTLDVDEIVDGTSVGLSPKRSAAFNKSGRGSGTTVVWRRCDRLDYRRLGWQERALKSELGRIYRRFIDDGLTLRVNGIAVPALDPLFLDQDFEGARASLAIQPLVYELPVGDRTSPVRVRFSELPVRHWHSLDGRTKRHAGIVGNAGVSIVRAGREISYGWHLMGSKRKENYDDWWRCEIAFEPQADEYFGITHTKQGVRPADSLRRLVEDELEGVARALNTRVRDAFENIRFEQGAAAACQIAHRSDPDLPVIPPSGRKRGARSSGPLTYTLRTASTGEAGLISYRRTGQILEVIINSDHNAFASLYEPLTSLPRPLGDRLRTSLELMLIAFARSQAVVESPAAADWSALPDLWSATLAVMLSQS